MSVFGIFGATICVVFVLLYGFGGYHQIPQGHVGVYFRGGALLSHIEEPGFHTMLPVVTSVVPVQITIQTDSVNDIPCGTSGGVMILFDKVEVVNRLRKEHVYDTVKNYTVHYDQTWIFDKIHHEINQFCSSHSLQEVYITLFDTLDEHLQGALQADCDQWAPGIEIIAVRVTKPRVPDKIVQGFVQIENEKTQLQISVEEQRVAEKRAETKRKEASIRAKAELEVAEIQLQIQVANQEAKAKMEAIEDDIRLHREKSKAEAAFYHKTQEARANEILLTSEYLQLQSISALSKNTKVYFGDKIPSALYEQPSSSLPTCSSDDEQGAGH
mmetsp:Transcript_21650/g.36431  ORF Transcript_21650/g.36431 Transcript_21650/m.36431 type:complete len:328 (+) Transcript_21650:54-1037(+)